MATILASTIFKCILMNKKLCKLIKSSSKFVPKGLIDNNAAFFILCVSSYTTFDALLYDINHDRQKHVLIASTAGKLFATSLLQSHPPTRIFLIWPHRYQRALGKDKAAGNN